MTKCRRNVHTMISGTRKNDVSMRLTIISDACFVAAVNLQFKRDLVPTVSCKDMRVAAHDQQLHVIFIFIAQIKGGRRVRHTSSIVPSRVSPKRQKRSQSPGGATEWPIERPLRGPRGSQGPLTPWAALARGRPECQIENGEPST